MEAAGVFLAIPGVLELCLKTGAALYKKYEDFNTAEESIRSRILTLEGHWLQIEAQVKYLRFVWDRLHARLQVHLNHVLAHLQSLLQRACATMDGLIAAPNMAPTQSEGISILQLMSKEGKLRRGIFALGKKDALDCMINDVRNWHTDMLGPSWFQLLRIPEVFPERVQVFRSQEVKTLQTIHTDVHTAEVNSAKELGEQILPVGSLAGHVTSYFGSDAGHGRFQMNNTDVVVDPIRLPADANQEEGKLAFCRLARKMRSSALSSLGLLQCLGVVTGHPAQDASISLCMVFGLPNGYGRARSLRDILIERDDTTPLNIRCQLAVQLAKATMAVHSLNIVHKNMRPETILVFSNKPTKSVAAFLVGFEHFRSVDLASLRRGDLDWRKAIYRHPARNGLYPQDEASMQHDIYSLGVCLLEIGLWHSFILDPSGGGRPHSIVDRSRITKKEAWRTDLALKERYQDLARNQLAAAMGASYADAVDACLSCLDKDNAQFGDQDDFDDKNKILIGVRFMEKVLLQLQQISL